MYANGHLPYVDFRTNPVYFVLLLVAVGLLREVHFYWVHRLIHWKPLYKAAHYLHHKNVNIGPWSGLSMHPIEHLIYFTGVFLHWIIPSHPLHAIMHLMHLGLSPAPGHAGFDEVGPWSGLSIAPDRAPDLLHRRVLPALDHPVASGTARHHAPDRTMGPFGSQRLARRFHYPRPDRQPALGRLSVAHTVPIAAKIAQYLPNPLPPWMLATQIAQPADHPLDVELGKDGKTLRNSNYFHYLHHRYFECNYGGDGSVPIDRWFGSFHDGSEEAHRRMRERAHARMRGRPGDQAA